ncbi:diguanylate cyclase [Acetobacteraceae bacterium KSS8]|uniref:diguanylate cyclase n=1 Tax=Endosaccharibacter trunci TaxID=2812733 RepID=A0ABT1W344_9PROT|nr:diguanylate cyclase [Acetobacteraceae bacterium KSS8]
MFGLLASAGEPEAAIGQQLAFESYGRNVGLTNAWFSCLQQGRVGYVFACTEHGLFFYNGRRFFNLGSSQGLPDGGIVAGIAFDDRNRLIVRYPHSLFVSTGPISKDVPPSALTFRQAVGAVKDNAFGSLLPWKGGVLLLGGGLLYFLRTEGPGEPTIEPFRGFSRQGDMPLWNASPLVAQGDTVWAVRSDQAICGLSKASPRCFSAPDGLPKDDWVALLPTPTGHILARSPSRLMDIDPQTGRVDVSLLPDQGGRYANYPANLLLALTPAGDLLTQSAAGLMIRRSSGWTKLATENGLPPVPILQLMFDRHGNLWLGVLGRGVMRSLGYGAWENLNSRDGLSDQVVWQIARQPGGPLWVATDGGVDAIGGPPDMILAHRHYDLAAFSLALDDSGHLWRSVGSDAVACITISTGETVRYPLPQVSRILNGPGGQMWFVTAKGIYGLDPGPRPSAPKPVADLAGSVTDAATAADGTLWLLRRNHLLHRHADGSVASLPLPWKQPDSDPQILTAGPTGIVWVAVTGEGLARLTIDRDRIVSTSWYRTPDIISTSIVSLLVDRRGWLWAGTDNGISVFDGVRWVSANATSGLISDDLDQNGLIEDTDGSMWFGTSSGLSHLLDPSSLFERRDLEPVITSVTVGTRPYRGQPIRYTRAPFVIQFGSLDFRADSVLRFRYRLDDVDQQWGDTASGYVRYPSVPPGRHRFELVAYDPLRHQSSAPVALMLRVQPPWWLWRPVLVCYALGICGLVYGLMRLRFRFLLRQREALQREVDLRTAQIREAQATDSLTGLLIRGEVQARVVGMLGQGHRGPQLVVGLLDLDHFKQINDRFGHLAGDEVLKELGRRLRLELGAGEYAGRYGGEEILIILETSHVAVERIRSLKATACGEPFRIESEIIHVTCSVGVAHKLAGDTWTSIIGRADQALYRAKNGGRNRIVHAGDE